jgi:hypothetical protein
MPKFESQALEKLGNLTFLTRLSYVQRPKTGPVTDRLLELETENGAYTLAVRAIGSYISQTKLDELLSLADRIRKTEQRDLLLLARYVPRSMAQLLISRGIYFVDLVGNTHLKLGTTCNWTVIGLADRKPERQVDGTHPFSRAELQFLFYAMDHMELILSPVRQLAVASGVSKSAIAQMLAHFMGIGLIVETDDGFGFHSLKDVFEKLMTGYVQVLRPKLLLHRYRIPGATTRQGLLKQLQAQSPSIRYSLTGYAALELLQVPAPGLDTTFFVADWNEYMQYSLGLEPDPQGPIVVLRAFGEMIFKRSVGGHMLAPDPLITAELAASRKPS